MNYNTEHFPAYPSKVNGNYLELANFSPGGRGGGEVGGNLVIVLNILKRHLVPSQSVPWPSPSSPLL